MLNHPEQRRPKVPSDAGEPIHRTPSGSARLGMLAGIAVEAPIVRLALPPGLCLRGVPYAQAANPQRSQRCRSGWGIVNYLRIVDR